MALTAAADVARRQGYTPVILGDAIEGEAREVATVMAGIAAQVARHGQPAAAPVVLLSGGETTVTVRGDGVGGRNVEFLLALGLALDQRAMDCRSRITALACDTDGVDGAAEVAGPSCTPMPARGRAPPAATWRRIWRPTTAIACSPLWALKS